MIKNLFFKQFLPVLILSVSLFFVGCEKKAEESKQTPDGVKGENVSPDTSASVTPEVEPAAENKIQIPDIKGTWTGTLDKRNTTLIITEQTDSSFSGNLSIKYKETLEQNVKGNFSSATRKVLMEDQIHSKYQGKYDGTFSEDFKNFSGTFTKNRDGSQYSFNLKKK